VTSSGANTAKGEPSGSHTGIASLDALAEKFSDLARALEHEVSVDDTLNAIVNAAVDAIPGAQHASISLVEGRKRVQTRAATSELAREIDRAQYETHQGPCLDSLYEHRTVRLTDISAEERWPQFSERACELEVGSMLSFQLFVDGDDLGALNLSSEEVDAFGDESENVGLLFASHAAVAMAGSLKERQLLKAVSSRDLIGQAKGILMERYDLTDHAAFSVLVRVSQDSNRKLVDLARELVDSRQLPKQ
jgi:transcriptional regulator with GAF, ATPase, and Fis domain